MRHDVTKSQSVYLRKFREGRGKCGMPQKVWQVRFAAPVFVTATLFATLFAALFKGELFLGGSLSLALFTEEPLPFYYIYIRP